MIEFIEHTSKGYASRTRRNASADATLAIAIDFNTAGEKLTKQSVLEQKKLYIPITPDAQFHLPSDLNSIIDSFNKRNVRTINIAGNGIYTWVKQGFNQVDLDEYLWLLILQIREGLRNKIELIRSGGQTGIDEAGLKAGSDLGIKTLCLAPKGWIFRNQYGKDIADEKQFKARFLENISPNLFGE